MAKLSLFLSAARWEHNDLATAVLAARFAALEGKDNDEFPFSKRTASTPLSPLLPHHLFVGFAHGNAYVRGSSQWV